MLIIVAILFSAQPAKAQEATVWAKDPIAVKKIYKDPNFKLDNVEQEKEDQRAAGYLNPKVRDAVFFRTGFTEIVASMDAVDKDLLVMTCHSATLKQLTKYYPNIKPEDLSRLKTAVEAALAK